MENVRFRLTKGEKGVYVQETDDRGSYLLRYGPFTEYSQCWACICQSLEVQDEDYQEAPPAIRSMFN